MTLRVLIIGGGGREHALAWKIAQSPLVGTLYAAPGNPGIAAHARCVEIGVDAHDDLVEFAQRERIDLTVIGPEAPLVAGLADRFAAAGLTVFGPGRRAAAIEGSKVFAKDLMRRHGIPTARFATFADADAARRFCREMGAPLVVKADGLAAGKGAIVCATLAEADAAIGECMERHAFGTAGARVVIEEFMVGQEVSFFVLSNGVDVMPLAALASEGAAYRGVLYVGLMLTAQGPKVVEFNCRFGDPECQALMVRVPGDLVPLLLAAARGEAWPPAHAWPGTASVCVNLASGGYPGKYPTGLPIRGVEAAGARPGVQVFHAGTAAKDGRLVTAGGRVLGVTAVAESIDAAIAAAYAAVRDISFEGMHYRTDIGRRRS